MRQHRYPFAEEREAVRRRPVVQGGLTLDEVELEYRAFILKQKELLPIDAYYWREHGTID